MTSKPIRVDILEMEMSKGLPHWLDPIARFKHTHGAAAQARRTFGQAAEQERRQRQWRKPLGFDRIASTYTNGLSRSSPSAIDQRTRPI